MEYRKTTKEEWKVFLAVGLFLIIFIFIMFKIEEYGYEQKQIKLAQVSVQTLYNPQAKDNLVIKDKGWERHRSRAHWKVYVYNKSDKAIKDVHFKMYYYAKSGTRISTGEETIYEVINGGEGRWFEFDEYLRDQVVEARIEIDNALWLNEKGKVYLDW